MRIPGPSRPAIGRIYAVEKDGVKMWRKAQVAVGTLNDGHRARLASGQAAQGVALAIPRRHRVGEDAHHLAQQLRVERERKAQREGQRKYKLPQRHVGQDMIHQVQGALVHPPAEAARAHGSGLTREGDDVVLAAIIAVQVREAPRENSAVQILVQFLRHELRQRAPAGGVRPLLLEGQQVLLQHLIKGSLVRLPARVDRAGRRRL